MKKINKYLVIFIMFAICSLEINYDAELSQQTQACGPNAKAVREAAKAGRKLLKGCKSCANGAAEVKPPIKPIIKPIKPIIPPPSPMVESLIKGLEEMKSADDVMPKIEEYLLQTTKNEGGVKTIVCFKQDANTVRINFIDGNTTRLSKVVSATTKAIDLAMYDINAMQETFYKGSDGVEYVAFRIPRRPQSLLQNKYQDRIYECMVFNLPKDIDGNWMKFKEFLIAFWNDILNRPNKLWDEFRFRQELSKLNINSRDLQEIREYKFAKLFIHNNNENNILQLQVA